MVAYLISDEGNISIVLNGKQYFVNASDDFHTKVTNAISEGKTEDEILDSLLTECKKFQGRGERSEAKLGEKIVGQRSWIG